MDDLTIGGYTMKRLRFLFSIFIGTVLMSAGVSVPLSAQSGTRGAPSSQLTQARVSPHDTINRVIERTNRVTIVYGRPYTKAPNTGEMRKVWGGLVPYGQPWRLGADEATLLITQQPIMIGTTEIPAGAHSLFMLPEENGPSKLIINNQIGQWGLQYDPKQDLARVDLTKTSVDESVDQLTLAIESNPSGGGILKITWEKTQFSVAFANKK
jgi:hypothetical protein